MGYDANAKKRHQALAKVTAEIHRNAVGEQPHYYLNYLGTSPALQGSGAGVALLDHLSRVAASANVPIYLETCGEKNPPFYSRRGYRITEKKIIDAGVGSPFDEHGGEHAMVLDAPAK